MKTRSIIAIIIAVAIIIAGVVYATTRNPNTQTAGNNSASSQQYGLSNSSSSSQSGADVANNGTVKTVDVSGSEFSFTPATITVNKGDTVKIVFTNTGRYPHSWVVDAFKANTGNVSSGQSKTVTFVANQSGTFEYNCDVPGHLERGMKGSLIVK